MGNLGSSDVDSRLEEQLIDGILYAFQEQTQEVTTAHFTCVMANSLVSQISYFTSHSFMEG